MYKFVIGLMVALSCLCISRALAKNTNSNAGAQTPGESATGNHSPVHPAGTETTISPNALLQYQQAVRELHLGQSISAEKDAMRAIHLDPEFADAEALAATAALQQKQFDRAHQEASDAVRTDPSDEKAWVILATAENYLGEYADAAIALGHVQQQDQATWQVAYEWARAEAGQDHAQSALEWSNRSALTAPPTFAPLHLLRASALLAINQNALAADELETYLSLLGANAPERAQLAQELLRIRAAAQSVNAGVTEYNALAN